MSSTKYRKNQINRKRQKVESLLQETGCLHCKSKENLTWHHKNPTTKTRTVSELLSRNASLTTIMQEIKKCIVLCVKCHSDMHRYTSIIYLIKFKLVCSKNLVLHKLRIFNLTKADKLIPIFNVMGF